LRRIFLFGCFEIFEIIWNTARNLLQRRKR